MNETAQTLRRKLKSGAELGSLVRTMKALAAANINQYERAVESLEDYVNTVQLGLVACLKQNSQASMWDEVGQPSATAPFAIVLGSDQGLIGQFNQLLSEFILETVRSQHLGRLLVWVVGERMQQSLHLAGFNVLKSYRVPGSVQAITTLVTKILLDLGGIFSQTPSSFVYLFYNKRASGAQFDSVYQRISPLDLQWRLSLEKAKWPKNSLPELINIATGTLENLIQEYIFVSLFRACAQSLASENASRLASMQRAEKNIKETLENLNLSYHHLRQTSIDTEMFDVIAGSEASAANEKGR